MRIPPRAFFSLEFADSRQVVERALGYAVAHELGHYLLATKDHSGAGLMRQSFDPAADLATRSTNLDPKNRTRLRQRIDMSSQCQAAALVLSAKTEKASR